MSVGVYPFATGIGTQNGTESGHYGHCAVGYCAQPITEVRMLVFNGGEWL